MKKKEPKKKEPMIQLYTPEGEVLGATETPWTVYPRPHLRRESFLCLNGAWDFAVGADGREPEGFSERSRVPFVPESILSGIGRAMPRGARLLYRRRFTLPKDFAAGRTLLHFGGVDGQVEVTLNGTLLGTHKGGYDAFSFDVSDLMRSENVLTVSVTEHPSDTVYPYGKQRKKRGGMWYTPVSGIWQTVWLEAVPTKYIRALRVDSYTDRAEFFVERSDGQGAEGTITLTLPQGEQRFPLIDGRATVTPREPILWSPETPHLYEVTVTSGEDRVSSYFALRSVTCETVDGVPRLCLNGKPYFFHGLLDQGYFSDGIFLPASPEGYERDILAAKNFGFNMLRKHIKVEPEAFYYACDRLGIAVFQDMVNNGDYSFLRDTALPTVGLRRRNDRRLHRHRQTREAFLAGMEATVARLAHHPSVVYWTIFNEGWGQFDHAAAYRRLKSLDGTRVIDSVSGWFLPKKGTPLCSDVESLHVYFKPFRMTMSEGMGKPVTLSEFGGYAHKAEGHSFNPRGTYGYRFFEERQAFEEALERLYREEILPAVREGLCAAVYTQLTDVEDETNGLLTYDRRVEKVSHNRMCALAKELQEAIQGSDRRA